jgi:adenylate cyclase
MKYRTKVMILLMAMVFVTTGISVGILYWNFDRMLREQMGSQILSVAATTAAFLDGDLHKAIKAPGDEKSPAYVTLRDAIRRARDANRRDDFYVKYAYTQMVDPRNPDFIRFGVDSEEDPGKFSPIGEAYRSKLSNPFSIDQYQYDKVFTKDDWGEFLTANAPIKDGQGNVVAALGMDIESSQVISRTARILRVALTALGASLLTALGVAIILANRASKPLYELRRTVEAIGSGDFSARSNLRSKDEFGMVGEAINSMAEGLEERKTLLSSIERYVPYKVVDSILHSPESPTLKGERRKLTVLVSDLRGFSEIAESRQPEEVVAFLNRCCEVMSDVIERHGGTLDKFVGDGMMATFGSPNDDPYQEERAVKAALDLQEKISVLSAKCEEENWPVINAGIGIHSGYAVVGSMGSSRHMEYTAIGETVNTAHNLESTTKQFGANILISQYTYNAVRGQFNVKRLGQVRLKGHAEPMVVYSVEGLRDMSGITKRDE